MEQQPFPPWYLSFILTWWSWVVESSLPPKKILSVLNLNHWYCFLLTVSPILHLTYIRTSLRWGKNLTTEYQSTPAVHACHFCWCRKLWPKTRDTDSKTFRDLTYDLLNSSTVALQGNAVTSRYYFEKCPCWCIQRHLWWLCGVTLLVHKTPIFTISVPWHPKMLLLCLTGFYCCCFKSE